jgi:16S rRNA (adenine1518-N6/adenine1519-N6)-dimethyltransferase
MNAADDLPSLNVTELLRNYGVKPVKRLGQNFLVDPGALAMVLEAAEIDADVSVLEIGAGLGSLTRLLARRARRVVAVELDENLLPPLYQVLAPYSNVEIVQGDILAHDPARLMGKAGYRVVANIPYYITSALIRHLLEARLKPQRLVLTVQREVAERICAGPGDLSLLALSVQIYGNPQIAARIPAGAFYPVPKVDSAVVRVDLSNRPAIPERDLEAFFRLAKAGFSQKRKTLRNSLAGGLHLEKAQASQLLEAAGIDPKRRAETLSLEEWGKLVDTTGKSI